MICAIQCKVLPLYTYIHLPRFTMFITRHSFRGSKILFLTSLRFSTCQVLIIFWIYYMYLTYIKNCNSKNLVLSDEADKTQTSQRERQNWNMLYNTFILNNTNLWEVYFQSNFERRFWFFFWKLCCSNI